MDPQKQLNDDGAVIGYSPILDYNTNVDNNNSTLSNQKPKSNKKEIEYHSTKLTKFVQNAPSVNLERLDDVYEDAKFRIETLSQYFVPSRYDEYNDIRLLLAAYESDNEDYINSFTDFHRYKIENGTIIPEVMTEIYNASKRVRRVYDTAKKLIYGSSDLSQDEIRAIDTEACNKMVQIENSGNVSQMNYVALSYDLRMSTCIGWYAGNMLTGISDLSHMAIKSTADTGYHDTTKASSVKRLFDELNDEIDYIRSSYNSFHSSEVLDKTLYNYYNKRREMFDLFDLSCDTNNDTAIRARDRAMNNLDNALSNMVKGFLGCTNYISEFNKFESEKKDIISLYAGLSQTV